jgi:hypothetical protein
MNRSADAGQTTSETRPSSVYRLYNEAGELLYVGLTDRGHLRVADHLASKPWAWEIAETRWEHFATRDEAAARERTVIEGEYPLYNIVGCEYRGAETVHEFGSMAVVAAAWPIAGIEPAVKLYMLAFADSDAPTYLQDAACLSGEQAATVREFLTAKGWLTPWGSLNVRELQRLRAVARATEGAV